MTPYLKNLEENEKKCENLVYFSDIREIQLFQKYVKISSNMFHLGCKSLLISNFMKMSVLRQKSIFGHQA